MLDRLLRLTLSRLPDSGFLTHRCRETAAELLAEQRVPDATRRRWTDPDTEFLPAIDAEGEWHAEHDAGGEPPTSAQVLFHCCPPVEAAGRRPSRLASVVTERTDHAGEHPAVRLGESPRRR